MTRPPTKGRGRKPGLRSSSAVHKQCSVKRTVLKDRIRALEGEIDSLQAELRIVTSSLTEVRTRVAHILTRVGIDPDPFGTRYPSSEDPQED